MIKEYIEFAIENWYIKWNVDIFISYKMITFEVDWGAFNKSILETITSKPFIEAIARGILKKYEVNIKRNSYKSAFTTEIEIITTEQAIAIRDWTLIEYITNLWIWKNHN